MPLKTLSGKHADPRKGRGAGINPEGRFEHGGRRNRALDTMRFRVPDRAWQMPLF